MPADPVGTPQLHLFASHWPAYQDALAHYEAIRPILKRERTLPQHSRETGLNYWRLWRHLRRFRHEGLLGLIDQRKLPHPWGKTSIEELLPRHIQQHLVQTWPRPPLPGWGVKPAREPFTHPADSNEYVRWRI